MDGQAVIGGLIGLTLARSLHRGLVGSNHGAILQCFATGSVRGDSSVAGLVGWQGTGQVSPRLSRLDTGAAMSTYPKPISFP